MLGPSHHYYTPKCAVSSATVYKTPIGDLSVDLEGGVFLHRFVPCFSFAEYLIARKNGVLNGNVT